MRHLFIITAILSILAVGLHSCKEENQPPTCAITTPANAQEFSVGDTITISADAEDVDGSITEVRFYVNGTGAGSSNSFPYSYTWDTDTEDVGLYTIKAISYDDANASASDEVVIELISGGGGSCPEAVTDIDGNTYNTVLIGDQCWMKENLKVTHYPNGDAIPYITDNDEWGALSDNNTDDAYCYYDDNINSEYGALYTYAASIADNWERDIADGQGICPDGWHLPTDAEWKVLEGIVDTQYPVGDPEWDDYGWRGYDAGIHLKSTTGWNDNGNGDNSSGFTALPGGYRSCDNGTFGYAGGYGLWWSATDNRSNNTWDQGLVYGSASVDRYYDDKSYGFSVRCVRDSN